MNWGDSCMIGILNFVVGEIGRSHVLDGVASEKGLEDYDVDFESEEFGDCEGTWKALSVDNYADGPYLKLT